MEYIVDRYFGFGWMGGSKMTLYGCKSLSFLRIFTVRGKQTKGSTAVLYTVYGNGTGHSSNVCKAFKKLI